MAENVSASAALAIVANCPFPLVILRRDGRVGGYNRAFDALVGSAQAAQLSQLSPQALSDHPAGALLTCEDTVCWTDQSNAQRRFEIHRTLLTDQDGAEVRFFVDVTREAELERARGLLEKKLREHTLTDPVTGLLSSRGVMLALEPQVARSRRYNSPISAIMLAVHGGDNRQQMLVAIARLLKDQLRWADLVGCNEQQEFVLVLPETTAQSALALAEKLRGQLEQLTAQFVCQDPVWFCYGVTAWHKSDSAASLLRRAASALVRAHAGHDGGDRLIAL